MPSASNKNYTSTNLAAGETFEGQWEPITGDNVLVTVYCDQRGLVTMQARRDANSTVETVTATTLANTQERIIRFSGKREFKLKFTNTCRVDSTVLEVAPYFGDYSVSERSGLPVYLITPTEDASGEIDGELMSTVRRGDRIVQAVETSSEYEQRDIQQAMLEQLRLQNLILCRLIGETLSVEDLEDYD